jgi:hypothetical protein
MASKGLLMETTEDVQTAEAPDNQDAVEAAQAKLDEITRKHDGVPEPEEEKGDEAQEESSEAPPEEEETSDGETDEQDASQTVEDGAKKVELTRRQREVARIAGISDEKIAALGEDAPELLQQFADFRSELSRQQVEVGEKLAALAKEPEEAKTETTEPPAGTPDEPAEEEEVSVEEFAEPSEVLKAATTASQKMVERAVTKVVADAESRFSALHENLERFEAQVNTRWAQVDQEHFFSGLDPKLYPQFGSGRMSSLAKDSPFRESRQKVIDKAVLLRTGYAHVNKEEMSWEQALNEALEAPQETKSDTVEDKAKAEKRVEQSVGRSTSRKTPSESSRQDDAYKLAAKKLADINRKLPLNG